MTSLCFASTLPLRSIILASAGSSRTAVNMKKSGQRSGEKQSGKPLTSKGSKRVDVPVVNSNDSFGADDRELLKRDVAAFKARSKAASDNDNAAATNAYSAVKDVLDKALVFDFFLVVALLGWLVVALVPHFAFKNDMLLDPWLALWQPFIQPVLGVLMLGTIVAGMISYMFDTSG